MPDPKSDVWGTRWAYNVDPRELVDLDELATWLDALLQGPCSIWGDGDDSRVIEIRQRVDFIDGGRGGVLTNEHAPPHIHVTSHDFSASFRIADCDLLAGSVGTQELRKIRHWHRSARAKLQDAWDSTRPTDCVVANRDGI